MPPSRGASPSREPYEPQFETFHKACTATASTVGQRNLAWLGAPVISPFDTISHYDEVLYPGIRGLVALTIDDAPCRQGPSACMAEEVRALLRTYEAKATFFVTAGYVQGNEDDMVNLISDGHEVANHCWWDCPYVEMSASTFEEHLTETEAVCESLRRRAEVRGLRAAHQAEVRSPSPASPSCCFPYLRQAGGRSHQDGASGGASPHPAQAAPALAATVRWFRAPSSMTSSTMNAVLEDLGYTPVLSDCFANDTNIADPEFIAATLLEQAMHGSIIVIHMPERGFREYNIGAMRILLDGLTQRGLQAVTLSALHRAAHGPVRRMPAPESPGLLWDIIPDMGHAPPAPANHLYRTSNVVKGGVAGTVCFVRGIVDGATGVVGEPLTGAMENGAEGFTAGLGRGLVGVVVKPVRGAVSGAAQILGGITATVWSFTLNVGHCVHRPAKIA